MSPIPNIASKRLLAALLLSRHSIITLRPDARFAKSLAFALGLLVLGGWQSCWAVDQTERASQLKDKIQPMLEAHCLDCHSGAEPDAGLSLDHFDTPLSILKGRSVWENAVQKMRLEEMPPPDANEMTDEERKYLSDWIEATIEDVECGLEPNPGKVTLRRLNAAEYRNTIRDLFGLKRNFETASAFPGDDVGYGFDNIGDVLTLPPLLMEKYFLEAERISKALIQVPPPAQVFEASYAGGQLLVASKSSQSNRELTLSSNGTATFKEQIPWSGPYRLTISAGGDQAGNAPCAMEVSVDGKTIRKRLAVSAPRDEPQELVVPLRLRAGSREIGISFTNDFYQKESGGRPKQDRNLVLHHVSLNGKKAGAKLDPKSLSQYHKDIIFTRPENDAEREATTRAVLSRIASRAFRRPVQDDDLNRLVELAVAIQEEGDSFEESIQIALQAILISPKFIFRVEPPGPGSSFEQYRDLDEFELATRLSYFLWSSMPDDQLLQVAWKGELRKGNQLEVQIARMIQDPRANEFVRNFAGQWLTLRKLRDFNPDKKAFPKWNERIAKLAEYETHTFFAGVMRKNMSVLRLLDADFTYLNAELANYYGIPGVYGEEFRPVSLEGTPRAGLLTQASVLAVTSNPTRTSPVKRGKWILENLLAKPPPPAPAGVPELEEKKGELTGTLRQRLEQHRANPACANCHKLMDPLGFALENFDAVGQYRTRDGTLAIDATGELPDGTKVQGASELQKILLEENKHDFVECLTEKMLTYAIGRGLEYYDKCAVDKIVQSLEDDDYRFSTLLVEIVRSDPFQKKGEREIQ